MSPFRHDIQHCRWASPTLLLEAPYWLNAWDFPWSCHRTGEPHAVENTLECRSCRAWEARSESREPADRRSVRY